MFNSKELSDMEEKINVAAILKDKPQGTKLYDWLYNIDVELDTISTTDTETVVWCTNETDNNTACHRGYSEFGTVRGGLGGLQILLPSKEMRDWNKFAWKNGDILVHKEGNVHIIFEGFDDDTYKTFHGKHYLWEYEDSTERYEENDGYMQTSLFSKAKEGDAQTYINTIEKNLGGKLNRETLEIEEKAIVDLKPKSKLKPFDKVLVRDSTLDKWRANLFGYIGKDGYYCCVYANWAYCIPYAGNENLLGTTKDVEG